MADDEVDIVRKAYAASAAGDLETLSGLIADDATWVVPGSSPFSGAKQGKDAIFGYLGGLAAASDGTLTTTQLAVAGGDGRVFSLDSYRGRRDGRSLDITGILVIQVKDGLVQSVQQYFEDTTVADAFWA